MNFKRKEKMRGGARERPPPQSGGGEGWGVGGLDWFRS